MGGDFSGTDVIGFRSRDQWALGLIVSFNLDTWWKSGHVIQKKIDMAEDGAGTRFLETRCAMFSS